MGELELDKKNCQVVWNISAEQAQSSLLGWRMIENNAISGILPFNYYYMDDRIYFRCSYAPLERIDCYFCKNRGNFESIFCICEGVLKVLERGEEYLLGKEGYLLLPEWIFWNRFEKKVAVCYLPGRREPVRDEYMALVEYLMQHTNHSDKRAVSLIYGLYDMLASDSFMIENLLHYLQRGEGNKGTGASEAEKAKEVPDLQNVTEIGGTKKQEKIIEADSTKKLQKIKEAAGTKRLQGISKLQRTKNVQRGKDSQKIDRGKESRGYFSLRPVKSSFKGRMQGRIAEELKIERKPEKDREFVVGRQPESDIYLPFAVISRKHAVFIYEENELYVMDLSSKNGTYLNGKKISAYVKTRCREKDVITFADISYHFEIPEELSLD